MEVLPLVLGLAAVEPLLVLGGLAAVAPLLVLVSALGAALGAVLGVGVAVLGEPVAAPAPPPGDAGEPGVPLVWAIDSPPNTRVAAAARVVRVFLVLVITISLEWNPRRESVERSRRSQPPSAYVSIRPARSGSLQEQHVGPQLSPNAAQRGSAGPGGASWTQRSICNAGLAHSQPSGISFSSSIDHLTATFPGSQALELVDASDCCELFMNPPQVDQWTHHQRPRKLCYPLIT
jgi:hypothetical protein